MSNIRILMAYSEWIREDENLRDYAETNPIELLLAFAESAQYVVWNEFYMGLLSDVFSSTIAVIVWIDTLNDGRSLDFPATMDASYDASTSLFQPNGYAVAKIIIWPRESNRIKAIGWSCRWVPSTKLRRVNKAWNNSYY